MVRIDAISAEAVVDSRGRPTLMVLMRSGDVTVRAKVPSGKSAGSQEVVELRDDDGEGMHRAIAQVDFIAQCCVGSELNVCALDEQLIALDGTANKSHLGGNAMLGVSIAAMRLSAVFENVPLWKHIATVSGSTPARPRLFMNMMNGGAHAEFRLPFQEYIVATHAGALTDSYAKARSIFDRLGLIVREKYGDIPCGDEGGYAPEIQDLHVPFELLNEAVGGEPDTFLAIDAAASEFYGNGAYAISGTPYSAGALLDVYATLVNSFPLKSIEDPFNETDLEAFSGITLRLGQGTLIVGDDLTVTNPRITAQMIEKRCANAMIIKPNQIGTLTEVFATIAVARTAGWNLIVSHRSGETDDSFVSDLAVGVGAYGIKAGAPTQMERRVKYERLVQIESELQAL